ncbi:unannotated protein [freshwater metagenome]|uniref:Unannotated protein n=1 Tax=freshwater metagenome TaxID=449393 RepID=A0A6J6E990_9ZZZZ
MRPTPTNTAATPASVRSKRSPANNENVDSKPLNATMAVKPATAKPHSRTLPTSASRSSRAARRASTGRVSGRRKKATIALIKATVPAT